MWPPLIMRLRIKNTNHNFGLWLPLFLVWPILLVLGIILGIILLPFLLIAAVLFWHLWWVRPLLFGMPVLFQLICALRGLKVEIEQNSERFLVHFW